LIPGVSRTKTGDFNGVGHPQVHLQRTESMVWEALDLSDFATKSISGISLLPPEQISSPLVSALDVNLILAFI
jgi:hypothetical protein